MEHLIKGFYTNCLANSTILNSIKRRLGTMDDKDFWQTIEIRLDDIIEELLEKYPENKEK